MRKTIYILFLLLTCHLCKGQLHYTFSSLTGTYTPLNGAKTATLTASAPSRTILDESFSNDIPIGFKFQYNGNNFFKIHLNSNGFAALGAPFLPSKIVSPSYDINDLRAGSGLKGAIRPILAPFWDNLLLNSSASITYKTENVAPNRVFTAQWDNMSWQGGSAAISLQLKLYETTNQIEFRYKQEAGAGGLAKSASIGITSENSQKTLFEIDTLNFLAVESLAPVIKFSKIIENDALDNKPNNGQIIRYTPIACMPPSNIKLSSYGTNTATIKWDKMQNSTTYTYALSNIDVNPYQGTTTADTLVNFKNLSSNTEYYFFIKNACGKDWRKFTFKTTYLAELPYAENFESYIDAKLPATMTVQNTSNSFADIFWQTSNALPAASGTNFVYNSSPFVNANTWLYTPSLSVIKNMIYKLSFKISTTGGGKSALDIKFGTKAGQDSMRYFLNSSKDINNTDYETKVYNFTAPTTGEYVIGFNYNANATDQILLIDDISIESTGVLPINKTLNLNATLIDNSKVRMWWQNLSDSTYQYQLERSTDGINFVTIANIENQASKTNFFESYDRNPNAINYYRLKKITTGGISFMSNIVAIKLKANYITALYPNPSQKEVFLRLEDADKTAIKVFSVVGQEISINTQKISDNEIKITPSTVLAPGIYLVHINSKTETRVLKWSVY